MNFLKNISLSKKAKVLLLVGIIATVLSVVFIIFCFPEKEGNGTDKNYNEVEQQIADSVKSYLSLYIELTEEEAAQAADAAVENYNIIMSSGVDVVNDSHTDIIKKRLGEALTLIEETKNLTEDEADELKQLIDSYKKEQS